MAYIRLWRDHTGQKGRRHLPSLKSNLSLIILVFFLKTVYQITRRLKHYFHNSPGSKTKNIKKATEILTSTDNLVNAIV